MSNNLISIIIPYYNGDLFIDDLLKSIKKQVYSLKEVVIVNDGSSEESTIKLEDLIKEYSNDFNIIYFKQNNGGISLARNKGIELASGEYLTFIDQDDILCGKYSLELRIDFLKSNPEIDLICGYNIKIDDFGKVVPTKSTEDGEKYYRMCCDDPENFYKYFLEYYKLKQKLFFFTTGSSLIRKSAIKDVKFNSEMDQVEDIDFTLQLIENRAKFKLLKIPFYFKRTHTNQASKDTSNDLEEKLLKKINNIESNLI